jgi:AcrR family transcriptional regulator
MRSTYHHGDLRGALVRAGREMLEEGGEGALSLRAVARRAGVSPMAPYRHFPDRAGLLAAVAADGFRILASRLETADRTASGRDALIAQGVAYVAFAINAPMLFRLMFGPELPRNSPEVREAADGAFRMLAGRVASTVGESARADTTLACWAIVHGLGSLAVDGRLPPGSDAPEILAARLGAMVLQPDAELVR